MKKRLISSACAVALSLATLGCSLGAAAVDVNDASKVTSENTFSVMTYNVGGLPLAGSSDKAKSALIGQEISKYDIINVQENFVNDKVIRKNLSENIVSQTSHIKGKFVGMDSFSSFPIKNIGYVKWNDSYGGIVIGGGADIYASKGVRYYTAVLPDGSEVDVYNFHTDADGSDTADDKNLAARRSNLSQLAALVNERSVSQGRAVIVMGDSNSRYTRVYDDFENLLVKTCGLTDVWVELVRQGSVPEKNGVALTVEGTSAVDLSTEKPDIEKVDKILYRSGDGVELSALTYNDLKLVDSNGEVLSDHNPLTATFSYKATSETKASKAEIISAKADKIASLFSSGKVIKIVTDANAASIDVKTVDGSVITPVSVKSKATDNQTKIQWTVKVGKEDKDKVSLAVAYDVTGKSVSVAV